MDRATRTWLLIALACGTGSLVITLACASGPDPRGTRAALSADDQACVACHVDALREINAAHEHGGVNALGCLDCHAPHAIDANGVRAASPVRAQCASCHAEIAAQFDLPHRHTLGVSITCTSCHPAHGLATRAEREHLRRDACVECHFELRGPFVFHHDGDKLQACISCHEPHGSVNRRMLTHTQVKDLCFECHGGLELSHVPLPGSSFRECLDCHTEIHGSNWDAELLR